MDLVSPSNGATVIGGQQYNITWRATAVISVVIDLYNATADITTTIATTENKGYWLWDVPFVVSTGVYQMQLTTMDDNTTSLINQFTISGPDVNLPPLITITTPSTAQTWSGGEEILVQYTSQVGRLGR